MRFLKTKIKLAQEARQRKQLKEFARPIKTRESPFSEDSPSQTILKGTQEKPCTRYGSHVLTSTFTNPVKNMIINYGKAIFSFAMSDMAKKYIDQHFSNEKIDPTTFKDFLVEIKPRITGYNNFEAVFAVDEKDSEEIALYRRVLRILGVVFVKYFSVNWIFHGKVSHKMVYLKHRFSVLRRITKG